MKKLLVADCLVRLCEGLPDVFLVVWALEVLRLSPSQFGLANSVLMATAILSYFPAMALGGRLEKKAFVVATFLFFTLFLLFVRVAPVVAVHEVKHTLFEQREEAHHG